MTPEEMKRFEASIAKIAQKAKEFGLDYYDMRFELCPAEIIYTFGAYGMPTRHSHWSYGKAFHKMKTQYDYNLSKIYELVINSDPCYAFLLDGNSLIQNKLVAAHVYAHCDFFKNNQWFRHTSRSMVETMARNAERIRRYEFDYGREKVEAVLDAALALQEHVDPRFELGRPKTAEKNSSSVSDFGSPYDDLWNLGVPAKKENPPESKRFPAQAEKDLLGFIARHARELEDWERDIIFVVREEMLYFWPQIETKIMNEGWATLWHSRIMREIDMTEEETVEYAKMHSSVIQPSKTGLNPYYLGLKIWESIEQRWEEPPDEARRKYGLTGGQGREKIFDVRATENDISFIRNYLNKELVEELNLYLFQKVYTRWQVVETEWEQVREGILTLLANGGFPYLVVEDGNFHRNGELYLKHCHDGQDLDLYYMEKTLPHVFKLWGRTVHLETAVDNKPQVFTYNGEKIMKKTPS